MAPAARATSTRRRRDDGGRPVQVDGRELRLTNLDKVLYPDTGFTKAEVLDYYTKVAPVLLPHLAGRPMTLKRYPDGVSGDFFFEKQCPAHRPDWMPTVDVPSNRDGTIHFCTFADLPSLIWAVNLAAIEMHPLLASAPDLDRPREVVFDLDPGPGTALADVAEVAVFLRDVLGGVGLTACVKSSGSKGLHLSVPLDGAATFDESKAFAGSVARLVEREWPDRVVASMAKAKRSGRVLIDWSQNTPHKSTVAPYSLRAAHPYPTVAAPLTWDEVEAIGPDDDAVLRIGPAEALARLDRHRDLYTGPGQRLPGVPDRETATVPMPDPAAALATYRSMRDFAATPEPSGEEGTEAPADGRFVIQLHDATRLHWDLRLEWDGVLASWALPRGLPWSPEENHLAVHTEDHPLEYLHFSGDIPSGNYGAGSMRIWDTGTYELVERTDRKVQIVLHGERAEGRYALFATRGRDWLIHRMDPPTDPGRRLPPTDWLPMGAVDGALPTDDDDVAYELRWPGARVLVINTPGETRIRDAAGRDVSDGFPEVRRLHRALGSTEVVLDGVIAEVRDGLPVPSSPAIERRTSGPSDSVIRRLARDHPVRLLAFDLIWCDGHPRVDRSYDERRAELRALGLDAAAWQVPAHHVGDGAAVAEAARQAGLPGIVAKRRSSPYRPGATSDDWTAVALDVDPA